MASSGHCAIPGLQLLGILGVERKKVPQLSYCGSDFQFLGAENISTETVPHHSMPYPSDFQAFMYTGVT